MNKLKDEIGKSPKIDLIIAKEADFTAPFLLCGEVKFFHMNRDVIKEIDEVIKELKVIKELGIAREVVLIVFDDYYYYRKRSKKKEKIEEKIREAERHGIKVFYGKSEAKLIDN